MARQRNNVTRLPAAARFRVSQLIDDGATYDAIRADAEIAAACGERRLTLHNNSIAAFAESAEHSANLADLRTWKQRVGRRRWAAKAISAEEGAASLADVAQLQILEQLADLAEGGVELTGKDVCKISNAIATMQRVELAKQDQARKDQIAAIEKEHAAEVAELQATIANLRAEVDALRNPQSGPLTPEQKIDAIRERLGVK